jgi:hypothetical protein
MSKKNARPCPALQRDITSKECGSDRQSRIPCPADCPWNPFALQNYPELQLIEKASDAVATLRLQKFMSATRLAAFSAQVHHARHDPLEMESIFRQEYFHRPGPDGLDFISQWEKAGWAGLNNDQRVYYAGHRQIAPMLAEYQGTTGEGKCHLIDLMNPDKPPILSLDLSLSAKLPRFTPVLLWQFPLPHYRRLFGVNLTLHTIGACTPFEAVQEIVHHLGGPTDQTGLLSWLALHFTRFAKAYHATLGVYKSTRVQHFDWRTFTSSWDYACPLDTILEGCNAAPLLSAAWPTPTETEAGFPAVYEIIAPSSDLATFQEKLGANIIGRLLITDGTIECTVLAEDSQNLIRSLIESALAPHLGPIRITVTEAPPAPAFPQIPDAALVPPRFAGSSTSFCIRLYPEFLDDPETGETAIEQMESHLTEAYRSFVHATPPELGGLTVQAAAARPEHRSSVARLIKAHYHSIDQLLGEKGYAIDIDDLVTGLGFPELIYKQPSDLFTPEKTPVISKQTTEDELDDEYYTSEFVPEFIGLPALIEQFQEIAGPFSEAEIQSCRQFSTRPPLSLDDIKTIRDSLFLQNSKDLKRIVKTSRQHWDLLHETLLNCTEECLSEAQDRYFSAELLELTYVLFPNGPPATPIDPRRLLYHLIQECSSWQSINTLRMSEALPDWLRKTPQPELSTLLCYKLINQTGSQEINLPPDESLALVPLLKAVLLELCHLPERH